MLTEKASEFKVVATLQAQVLSSSKNGDTVDTSGFNSAIIVINVGANGGTLDSSNLLGFRLEDSDDASTWTEVTEPELIGGYQLASATSIVIVNSDAGDNQVYKFAYTGIKRYLRIKTVEAGTVVLPATALILLGDGLKPQA